VLIALIPARSGSKRVPGKNIRELAGHPLLAYSIQVAKDSGLFGEHIYVTSDSQEYLDIAESYGAKALPIEPKFGMGHDDYWIEWALQSLSEGFKRIFILRPTSPFRTVEMLRDAYAISALGGRLHPLKAISPIRERPEKMWCSKGTFIEPYTEGEKHLDPSYTFNALFLQDSSLEIRHTGYWGGQQYRPYFSQGYEGFSIDYEDDWILAEALIERGLVTLPGIK